MLALDVITKFPAEEISTSLAETTTFYKITDLFEKEDTETLQRACLLIEETLKNQCFDIRLIIYYCYGYFTEQGIKGICDILDLIEKINTNYSSVIALTDQNFKQFDASLVALFKRIASKLRYYEKIYQQGKTHPNWQKFILDVPKEQLESYAQHIEEYKNKLESFLSNKESLIKLSSLSGCIKEMVAYGLDIEPKKNTIDQPDQEEPITQPEPVLEQPHQPIVESQSSPASPTNIPDWIKHIQDSKMMIDLVKKLDIFSDLVANKEFQKAALVSNDISHIIENFDPALYFPKLFANYFVLLTTHINELKRHEEKLEQPQGALLHKLYQIDLNSFLEWKQP